MEGLRSCVWCRAVHYANGMWKHDACVVANRAKAEVVANKVGSGESVLVANKGSRHGVYRDVEARRAYMREYMRRRRHGDHGGGVAGGVGFGGVCSEGVEG